MASQQRFRVGKHSLLRLVLIRNGDVPYRVLHLMTNFRDATESARDMTALFGVEQFESRRKQRDDSLLISEGEFKNSSRRCEEAGFGARNNSASLPRRLRLLQRFLNSPCTSAYPTFILLAVITAFSYHLRS
jgi:hypothetical protein